MLRNSMTTDTAQRISQYENTLHKNVLFSRGSTCQQLCKRMSCCKLSRNKPRIQSLKLHEAVQEMVEDDPFKVVEQLKIGDRDNMKANAQCERYEYIEEHTEE